MIRASGAPWKRRKSRAKNGMSRPASFIAVFLAVSVLYGCGPGGDGAPDGMVLVPEGVFIMGSDDEDSEGLAKEFGYQTGAYFADEHPTRKVYIGSFYMDLFEVTNLRYLGFVNDTGHRPPPKPPDGGFDGTKVDHPVVNVSWYGAAEYCKWAGKRLPTEEEWEKAARGTDGRRYPWGDDYDAGKGNLGTSRTSPVGSFKEDKSPYGVFDMAGNVMEWVETWYGPYPGGAVKEGLGGRKYKVLRGGLAGIEGHYTMNNLYARTSFRHFIPPELIGIDSGFRCAKSVE